VPEIGPDDVLIKINKTGICGTDIHIWNWDEWAQRPFPCRWSPAMNSPARSSNSGKQCRRPEGWPALFGRRPPDRQESRQSGPASSTLTPKPAASA
jgi:hypothetical protein